MPDVLIRAMASGMSTCPTYRVREVIHDHILKKALRQAVE
jgi:hypothetical protein